MSRPWAVYLILGTALTGTVVAAPAGAAHDALYTLTAASGVLAVVEGVRRNRPHRPAIWRLIAAGMACWIAGSVVPTVIGPGDVWARALMGDAFFLAMYPLELVALVLAVGHHEPEDRTAQLDAWVRTTAAGLTIWVLIVEPVWTTRAGYDLAAVYNLVWPLGDVAILGGLARLSTRAGAYRSTLVTAVAFVGAMVALGPVEAVSGVALPSLHPVPFDGRWLIGFVIAGTAALHPSMRLLSAPRASREPASERAVVWLLAAMLTGPALLGWELSTGRPISAASVTVFSAVIVVLVAVRMVAMVRQINRQATTDDVTGLSNRRALLTVAGERLAAPGSRGALLLLDLDRFTEVNDSLGHSAGDQLLVQVARRLREGLSPDDVLARLGSDEFAVLLRDADRERAELVADGLAEQLTAPFRLGDVAVGIDVSIGVALHPDHASDVETLVRLADAATHRAKRVGPVCLHGDPHGSEREDRERTATELRAALATGQLVLHYQPKVALSTGVVVGVEALVRWQHPTRGLLYPDAFLDVVEETGLMRALTDEVLRTALDQVATWRLAGAAVSVAVNLPASILVDVDLPTQVQVMLAERRLPATALELEITEESLMSDRARARTILSELRDNGVRIAVDDFGTGYSSLAYLRDLPIDELKLDRSFVFPMSDDPRAVALVSSTIGLAHSLGLRMVAEGVENGHAYRTLARIGCDQAQGYYLSPPLPAEQLGPWLAARRRAVEVPHQVEAR
ncbi:EAL domain-containing protein [Isoptericola sp. b441]|uniref:EAL domain-containing protein n=1 Tax=Actinotalea lenta TaxID=3064654 RepID=A0ABT9D7F0_9CELL|nr:EAL domain-containing protein [Isoptericola sp. b441]MDO8106356.1 EAL domain-containing protein [Isoptericola sp. b441]